MMIDLCNRLVDNGLSKEELLENVEIVGTSYQDAPKLTELLAKCFNLPSQEVALRQLIYSNAQLDNSVKLVDKRNGDIYGFLIFSIFPINVGSPLMHINAKLGGFLIQYKQINGHSFIIDERLRGTGLDKKMLLFQKEFLDKFDLIWCAVEKSLKSLPYWHKLGFIDIFITYEATFLIKPINKELIYLINSKLWENLNGIKKQ